MNIKKNPKADPECKSCGGYGRVNVGSICYGFGARPDIIECMCILYRKLGIDPNKPKIPKPKEDKK